MADSTLTIASFCSGVGLLDLGVRAALEFLGFKPRAALFAEWEAYAAAVLLARMEDQSLEPAPVYCGDLADFDGRSWLGAVDIVVAGLPCQPYSQAGRREGNADARSYGDGSGPLPQFLRIVSECRPAVVFLENVPAWVRGGWFRPFGEELSRLGYSIEQPVFVTAESVGGSHRRQRVFIMAVAERLRGRQSEPQRRSDRGVVAGGASADVADAPRRRGVGTETHGNIAPEGVPFAERDGVDLADAAGTRLQGDRLTESHGRRLAQPCGPNGRIFAPGPADDWGDIPTHLHPAIERGVCLLVDGRTLVVDQGRADQLRCAGNGCVPLCAAAAFIHLIRTAGLITH